MHDEKIIKRINIVEIIISMNKDWKFIISLFCYIIIYK